MPYGQTLLSPPARGDSEDIEVSAEVARDFILDFLDWLAEYKHLTLHGGYSPHIGYETPYDMERLADEFLDYYID